MTRFISVFAGLVFIGNFVLGSIAFIYFLNWYDTGQMNSDGWQYVTISSFFVGCLALLVESWLYKNFVFWPKNPFLFFLRLVIFSTLGISFAFGIGSAISEALVELSTSSEQIKIGPILLVGFIVMLFYGVMVIPFGTIVGLVNGFVWRKSRSF